MEFYTQYARLTDEQYAAIGRVAVHWSLVETTIETILARLAYSPEYFGRAITNDLGIDNRIRAIRTLCNVHEVQLGNRIVSRETVSQLRNLAAETAAKKGMRNRLVHSVWFRSTDEKMFGNKFRTGPAKRDQEEQRHLSQSFHEINQFAAEIEDLACRLGVECEKLPKIEWP
jgi:hypothetical protein